MDSGEKDEIRELGRGVIELDTKLLAQETEMVFGDTRLLTADLVKDVWW